MNLYFKSIKIKNFLSIGEAEVMFDEKGFTLVQGINNENPLSQSNGSGKSSIFDAIFWTLTGSTLRGTTDVKNDKLEDDCKCSLEFTIDHDNKYLIERSQGSNYNYCEVSENDIVVADQVRKSQDKISEILGPVGSSEVLGSIILLGQGLPYKFSNLSPIGRKNMLETLSGASSQLMSLKYQVDTRSSKASKSFNDLGMKISKTEGEVSGLEVSKSNLEETLSNSKSPEEVDSKIKEIDNINKDLESKILDSMKDYQGKEKEYDSLNKIKNEVHKYIMNCEIQINDLDKKAKSSVCPTCGRPYDEHTSLEDIKREVESKKLSINSTLNTLRTKYDSIQMTIDQVSTKGNESKRIIDSCRFAIIRNNEEKSSLIKSKEVSEGLVDKIDEIKNSISSKNVEIYDYRQEQNKVNNEIEILKYIDRLISKDFKGYMLEGVINFLSSRSSYYSKYLFYEKSVSINLSGNKILITLDNRPYENLSGGEKQRVDLVVQFSLRDMLSMTTGFSCNVLILDEAFDNLDSEGSNSLVRLLTSEFNDVESVFVVTHHYDISVPYDNCITVTKGADGVSEISYS